MNINHNFLRKFDGPLTRDLVLAPGQFGLGQVPKHSQPDATTTTVCGFCSTGCGLNVHLRQSEAINLTPATDYPVNLGMACPKGWEALTPLAAQDRVVTPLLRGSGIVRSIDWDSAMQVFTLRFKAIQDKWGPASIAFISTGQIVTEEMAFLGALAKFGMGMLHGDGNTRQCMATAATAYKQSFGFDAPPFSYADFEESDVIVLVGSNVCIAHPILWQRILQNKRKPRIVVIDPRATETALAATHHLPIRPKSDLTFFYGVANALIERQWLDQSFIARHTVNYPAFAEHVSEFSISRVSAETGLTREQFSSFIHLLAPGNRVSYWWTMGVNQSHEGTRLAQSIINLALMTGNIGKPGTGANSITGQCNAMGSRLFSNTSSLLGGRNFASAEDRSAVSKILGIEQTLIQTQPGYAYDQIMDAIDAGEIKGLWIIATNTAHSWIDQQAAKKTLSKLDFLVVQDLYHSTETAALAHMILPAAGWGEKEGTFINSERRIGLTKKVRKAPGQALSDFNIFRLVSQYWGCGQLFSSWSSPQAVFQILKRLSKDQPCDISGIEDYRHLDRLRGVQWPWADPHNDPPVHRSLFEDGHFYHSDRKARFLFDRPRPPVELCTREFPFILLTGRGSSAQWHTQTRTGKSAILRKLYPADPYFELHPEDARRYRINSGDLVTIESSRGKLNAAALVTSNLQPGQIFMPMHYATTNLLTCASFDPHSRQPSYKYSAVRIYPAANGPVAF
ncbi:MAG: nitrate reductase [Verrucomicrobiota bacterium]|nr:nitrate reductase [Verrucomicrobiota bacterium]